MFEVPGPEKGQKDQNNNEHREKTSNIFKMSKDLKIVVLKNQGCCYLKIHSDQISHKSDNSPPVFEIEK